ncbi:Transcriptional repressor TCF25 family protein [Cryptosporidium meleagridis]|uniref:Transcriptional repressor TCF25 family protein n=1 Tax=Cryptosporidium meleagridis TaxID=93969 RepID=A0A2P4Z3U3_9CRYT|nr:Transcriptional repressor TCF25 family protein [Cryptosporidium meleagridis]
MVSKQFKRLLEEKKELELNTEGLCNNSFNDFSNVSCRNSFNALVSHDEEVILSDDYVQPKKYPTPENAEHYKKQKKKNKKKGNKKLFNETFESSIPNKDSRCCLTMNKKYFNCENEICSIFGNEAVKFGNKSNSRNFNAKNSHLNIRHYFISCDSQWPHLNREESGLIMKFIEEKNEFSISFDIKYIKNKELLDILIDSMLLDEIYIFMEKNPFFFSGLIRLAEISTLRDEHEVAFKHLQKALYVFESSLHPSFSPFKYTNGLPNTAIKSSEIESRDIFIMLGYYMIALGNRGLFRTALEYCLLLISMDIIHDRFHSLLHLDYYAVLSSEFETLFQININFINQFRKYCTWNEKKIVLTNGKYGRITKRSFDSMPLYYILPNFAFGIPLALYIKHTKANSLNKEQLDIFYQQINDITIDQIISSKFDTNQIQKCSIYLIQSMLVFPEFVSLLKENIESSQIASGLSAWDKIYDILGDFPGEFDANSDSNENNLYPYLLVGKLLVEANMEKCKQIWKKPVYFSWVNACCDKIYNIISENAENSNLIKLFVSKRRNMLFECKFNVFRYLDVKKSEFSINPTLPSFFRDENPKSENFLESNSTVSRSVSLFSDPISLYFLSLLPWYTFDPNINDALSINLKEIVFQCLYSLKNYLNRSV